jgi:beta-lactamase regulating signal transducer with metallopeptidase domain
MSSEWNGALFRIALDSSLRMAVIAAMVAPILLAFRVRSSGVRHAAWTAVLCSMLLMPVLPYCVPPIAIPLPVAVGSIEAIPAIPATWPRPDAAQSSEVLLSTPAPAVPSVPIPGALPESRPIWPTVALIIYGVGILILLFQLLLGWRYMRRIARMSRRIKLDPGTNPALPASGAPVHESELVATPLTAGVVSPRIILPATWRSWPAEKLSAVLAHEFAHMRRRDSLISLLAHLNRCDSWTMTVLLCGYSLSAHSTAAAAWSAVVSKSGMG